MSSVLCRTLEAPLKRGNLQDHGRKQFGIDTPPAEVLVDLCLPSARGVPPEEPPGVRSGYASRMIRSLFNLRSVSGFKAYPVPCGCM